MSLILSQLATLFWPIAAGTEPCEDSPPLHRPFEVKLLSEGGVSSLKGKGLGWLGRSEGGVLYARGGGLAREGLGTAVVGTSTGKCGDVTSFASSSCSSVSVLKSR